MPLKTSPADGRVLPIPGGRGRRWGAFLVTWGAIGMIWCGALPLIARRPAISARLDELAAQGIDASAMYYTELPAMDAVLGVLREFHERHPADLWTPVWDRRSQETESAGRDE